MVRVRVGRSVRRVMVMRMRMGVMGRSTRKVVTMWRVQGRMMRMREVWSMWEMMWGVWMWMVWMVMRWVRVTPMEVGGKRLVWEVRVIGQGLFSGWRMRWGTGMRGEGGRVWS